MMGSEGVLGIDLEGLEKMILKDERPDWSSV
jgi:hypothetical protein